MIAATPAPALSAPTTARIGHTVRVIARRVKAARYTLTLVYDHPPARNARCLADIGAPVVARAGTVALRGTVPRMLDCYQGAGTLLGSVATAPGQYHFVVGRKLAPNGWDDRASFVRRRVLLVG